MGAFFLLLAGKKELASLAAIVFNIVLEFQEPKMSNIANTNTANTINVDRAVFAFAGSVNLASALLAWFVSPYWLGLTVFVSLNLLQSSITGFCPAASIFKFLGLKAGCAFK